ncbi:hypothetical protein PIB30_007013 [Stylosanthes scabra]|uniref:Uncharacterized protein n=1 Tax=Stylosanthes scabra TaxID=79078 RepID=A0ABU6Z181_9FABA|nr:hypothetical protein [Stylosanthes scabra]
MRDRENPNSRGELCSESEGFNHDLDTRPFFMRDRENLNARNDNDGDTEKSYRPMNFVRGVMDEDGQIVLSLTIMLQNNTLVTVTDCKGNIKLSGSVGSMKEMKSVQKLARYAAEATSEVAGRRGEGQEVWG